MLNVLQVHFLISVASVYLGNMFLVGKRDENDDNDDGDDCDDKDCYGGDNDSDDDDGNNDNDYSMPIYVCNLYVLSRIIGHTTYRLFVTLITNSFISGLNLGNERT